MSTSQAVILYFFILPLISFLIMAVIESIREDKKALKIEIMELRKANRIQKEEYEKEIFLCGIKRGLSTGIDKPNKSNALL